MDSGWEGEVEGHGRLLSTPDHASRGDLDLTELDPIPEHKFDQSTPDDFAS